MGLHESAAKPKPVDKPSRREAVRLQSEEAVKRAKRRWQMAKLAYHTDGSYRDKRRAVIAALDAGVIVRGSNPSVSTIHELVERYDNGEISLVDFLDCPRSGRPRKHMAKPFRDHLQQAIDEGSDKSARELHGECVQLAKARGCKAPTYHQVKVRIKNAQRLRRAAARHGSRAGEIDGLPHGRILARKVHDLWCLDELTMPVWIRAPDVNAAIWYSILCDLVLIVDVRSSAVVGWYLVDPEGRVNENGDAIRGAAREEDVLAALLSAARPELAPDSTQDFAGSLPLALRWDNHQAHKALKDRIVEEGIEIDLHFIRKRRAISNGSVENRVGTLKRWTKGLRGHVDRYLPTDQVRNEAAAMQARYRTALAGGSADRTTERLPIEPSRLMDVHELRDAFNRIVARYNHEHVNRVFNETAAQRFFRFLHPRRPRNGDDLLALLKPQETVVTTNGILHYHNNREWQFETILEDSFLLLDSTVIYRPDPLMRGIFIERNGRHCFVPPTPSEGDRASEIARNQIAIARHLSDRGKEARKARYVVEVGSSALDAAEQEYADQIDLFRETRGNGNTPADAEAEERTRPEQLVEGDGEEDIDPYAEDNLDRFVGPAD